MYDLVIKNGTVIDTVFKKQIMKNIGIIKNKIHYVGGETINGKVEIDAAGKIICPGFIDVHGHIDGYDYSGELAACQGITTTVGGNCGLSPVHMGEFFAEQEKRGFYINQAEMIGHSFSLRNMAGIKDNYKKASEQEIALMEQLAVKALKEGACGLSFGLDYSPGASLNEIKALAGICAEYNKIMAIHTRLFTESDLNSIYEVLSIAKETGVQVLFSHFVYQYGNGTMEAALETIERGMEKGIKIHIDSGMYTDWATFIGTETFSEQTIKDNGFVLGDMVVATGKYTGKLLTKDIYHLLRTEYPEESVICMTGKEEEIYMALEKDYAMPSTDIGTYPVGEGHPQIAGTFPKYLIQMVRERKKLSLEEAIYKATLLPASLFGFKEKGKLEEGADADILIFDFNKLEDKALYPHLGRPDLKPEGMEYVIVQGEIVVKNSVFTGKRAGRTIPLA